MAFEFITLIIQSWSSTLGGTMIFPFIIAGTIALILMLSGAGKYSLLLVLLPLVSTMIAYGVASSSFVGSFGSGSPSVIIVMFMILGLFVAFAFWGMMRN